MPRAASTADTDRLLHSSPQRTVYATSDPESGEARVCKVFVAGSLADAQHETAMAIACAGPGVVRYLDAGIEPQTNRPCTRTVFVDGKDLDALVAERGALPAALACRLLAPVAATLAAMHAVRSAEAPHGIAHGDVKPKNLLATADTTVLLDFEHARPIPHAGHPAAAVDVHALGTTLRWLLTGGGIGGVPRRAELAALIDACTTAGADGRPTAAELASRLAAFAAHLDDDPDEAMLDAAARGQVAAAAPARGQVAAAAPARDDTRAFCERRRALLRRLPRLLDVPSALPAEPKAMLRELRNCNRVLARFPRHPGACRRRRDLCDAAGRLVAEAAATAQTLRRAEDFAGARQWLADSKDLVQAALAQPGGCPIPYAGAPHAVGLLHRDPSSYLQHLIDDVAAAQRDLESDNDRIVAAEGRLDMEGAMQAIDALAAHHGGSAPTVTRRRDQLHRLTFYVDRVGRAQPNVERAAAWWDAAALRPLSDFVASAAAACRPRTRADGGTGIVGLRSLQITLANLGEEFPHVAPVAGALEALSQALAHLTDHGWTLLAEAERCLRAVPVPVRPLQVALSRLDSYRILEAFVDRPGRPRSQLQDALESLRLRLDQARATRDRLAEGAENAMARGHWTTGLFEMERAVADIDPADEGERDEAARLAAKLAEARQRKQEVDAAVRRNVELATRYGTMLDDTSSSFGDRLAVLAERRECLQVLTRHAPAERTVLYRADLRDVETQIAVEQAAQAEHTYDGLADPIERLRVARETFDLLTDSIGDGADGEPAARKVRLLEHWRTLASQSQQAVDQDRDAARQRDSQRRRLWRVGSAAALASAAAIVLGLWPWLTGGAANAASRGRGEGTLTARATRLAPALRGAADRLAAAADAPGTAPAFDLAAWHVDWERDLHQFLAAATELEAPAAGQARDFALACWRSARTAAAARLDDAGRSELDRRTRDLVAALAPWGLDPTRD